MNKIHFNTKNKPYHYEYYGGGKIGYHVASVLSSDYLD